MSETIILQNFKELVEWGRDNIPEEEFENRAISICRVCPLGITVGKCSNRDNNDYCDVATIAAITGWAKAKDIILERSD